MADRIKNYAQEASQISTLKNIRTALGVSATSYTPDASVVTRDRVATYAQAEEANVVLGDIQTGVQQLVAKVAALDVLGLSIVDGALCVTYEE